MFRQINLTRAFTLSTLSLLFVLSVFGISKQLSANTYADSLSKKDQIPLVAPTDVSLTPGVGYITVTWSNGQNSLDTGVKYTVSSMPSGLSCTVKDESSCNIKDTVSTPYSFSVTASNNTLGVSPSSDPSAALSPHLVLVVAGQSNATGYQSFVTDPDTGIDYMAPPYTNGADDNDLITWLPWSLEDNAPTPSPLDTPQNLTGSVPGTVFGPEIGLARQLWTDNQTPVTIIKDAYNGTTLGVNWAPNGSGALPNGLFPAMVNNVVSTMYNDSQNGQFDVLGGFYWYQGESDSFDTNLAKEYKNNLVGFIKALRSQLPMNSSAPIVLAKEDVSQYIAYGLDSDFITQSYANTLSKGNDEIRADDDYAAAKLPNVYEVDTAGLDRVAPVNLHLSNTSELTIGEEMANISVNHLP